jgi:RNA polymerase sigma-70 factor (ECF subfamily)
VAFARFGTLRESEGLGFRCSIAANSGCFCSRSSRSEAMCKLRVQALTSTRPLPVTDSRKQPEAGFPFRATYAQYFGFVWRNLQRFGVPAELVDDALQDVFFIVHRRSVDYESERSSLRSWLFGIVRRVAKDYRRSHARKYLLLHSNAEVIDPDTVLCPEDSGPEQRVELADQISLLHRTLDLLNEKKRTLLIMVELEQMTAPEIAGLLEIPLNTVYSRLRSARRELQELFTRESADLPQREQERASSSTSLVRSRTAADGSRPRSSCCVTSGARHSLALRE